MKIFINATLVVALSPLVLLSAEPSAFGAGDLTNPNPYGLTSKEKILLETKDKLHKVEVKSHSQENAVETLSDRIDGIQSVIDAMGRKSHKNKKSIQILDHRFNKQINNLEIHSENLRKEIQNNNSILQNLEQTSID